jgi:UDP:flavonoid glycosyltransferase YjiC (YdhE family)
MKILFLLFSPPTGTWGSLTRVLALAERASAEGDEIAFCASGVLAGRLRDFGYRVFDVPRSTMFGLPLPISRLMERKSQKIALPVKEGKAIGSVWFVLKLSGMTGRRYLERLVAAELAVIEGFKPDVLFTEMDPGAFLASMISGIRLFATYASVMERGKDTRTYARLMKTMRLILKEHGVSKALMDGPYNLPCVRWLVPSIPELEEPGPEMKGALFAGSFLGSFGSARESGFELDPTKRYVFAYVGTGSVSLGLLMRTLPEVFPSGSDTLCLVGAQSIRRELRLGNVVFRPYFDAGRIIPHCEWVICHGGHNTIMQSLSCGVPLLIFPGPIFERRFNASMVQRSGAGFMLELSDFRKERILEAMSSRDSCAAVAQTLGERIRAYDGPGIALAAMREEMGREREG